MRVARGIIHYKQTLWIDPKLHPSHNNLGLTPRDADRLNEAIGHYEKALRIDPGLFRAHAALRPGAPGLGRFREAEAATRRCLDRLPEVMSCDANVLAQLRRCERLIALQDRLPAVLQGKDKPADAAETLEFAELCGILGQLVAAARLYAEALAASPRLAEDLRTDHRYRAACAAALAGCGRAGTGPSSARRSGRAGASGPASGSGPRSPSGPRRWTRSARGSRPGPRRVGASVGRPRPGRAAGPGIAG